MTVLYVSRSISRRRFTQGSGHRLIRRLFRPESRVWLIFGTLCATILFLRSFSTGSERTSAKQRRNGEICPRSPVVIRNAMLYDHKLWVSLEEEFAKVIQSPHIHQVNSLDFMRGAGPTPKCRLFAHEDLFGKRRVYFTLPQYLPSQQQLAAGTARYAPAGDYPMWVEICVGKPDNVVVRKQFDVFTIFFTSRYTSNFWHWTNEVALPLFTTLASNSSLIGCEGTRLHMDAQYGLLSYGGSESGAQHSAFSLDLFTEVRENASSFRTHAYQFQCLGLGLSTEASIYDRLPDGILTSYSNWILQHVRRTSSEGLEKHNKSSKPHLLYIQRTGRRKLHDDKLIAQIAQTAGYSVTTWQPESSMDDAWSTIKLVRSADVIVGSFGSEMTNSIFMRTGAHVIMFCPCLNAYLSGVSCDDIYFRNIAENHEGTFKSISEGLVRNCSTMPSFQNRQVIFWEAYSYSEHLSNLYRKLQREVVHSFT